MLFVLWRLLDHSKRNVPATRANMPLIPEPYRLVASLELASLDPLSVDPLYSPGGAVGKLSNACPPVIVIDISFHSTEVAGTPICRSAAMPLADPLMVQVCVSTAVLISQPSDNIASLPAVASIA